MPENRTLAGPPVITIKPPESWPSLRRVSVKGFDRRTFLSLLASTPALIAFQGCERHRYIRPAGELDLGTVRELLYSVVHVRSKAVLVYRDAEGWRALSTRCTYNGCDCTYQEPILLCPCCRSQFDLEGRVLRGSIATHNLPWIKVTYRDGHLYADPGQVVSPSDHFQDERIEEAIRKLRERIKDEGIGDEAKIPELLLGSGTGEPGQMFLEDDPELMHKLRMIK